LPHLEQRIRSASPLRVTDQPDEARQGFRVDLTARAAVTDHTHWELTEGIVQFPDVGQHARAHGADRSWGVHAVLGEASVLDAGSSSGGVKRPASM
jgi:hypothetical protein